MEDNNTKIQSRRHQHVAEEMGHDNEEEKDGDLFAAFPQGSE